jgi:hypothetical protein
MPIRLHGLKHITIQNPVATKISDSLRTRTKALTVQEGSNGKCRYEDRDRCSDKDGLQDVH